MGLDFETTDGDDARKAIKALEQRLKDNLDESAKDRAHVKELEIEERNAKDKLRAIDSAFASRREDFAGVPREQTVIRLLDERDGLRKSYRDANAEYAKNIDAERAKVKALEAENESIKAQLFLLQNFGFAAKPAPVAAPEAWTDLETYSYRRAGDVLLIADNTHKGVWLTLVYGSDDPEALDPDGATREEAKAILDAAVAPKGRFEARGEGAQWYVWDNGDRVNAIRSPHIVTEQQARAVAAALNAAEPTP